MLLPLAGTTSLIQRAQKEPFLLGLYAPKGQPAYSPGHRPGYRGIRDIRPVRAKALSHIECFCPFRAQFPSYAYPGRCPGLLAFCPFGASTLLPTPLSIIHFPLSIIHFPLSIIHYPLNKGWEAPSLRQLPCPLGLVCPAPFHKETAASRITHRITHTWVTYVLI